MTTPHKYAEILRAIADGVPATEFEFLYSNNKWVRINDDNLLFNLIKSLDKIRRKPRTININGFLVPEPLRDGLEIGGVYFLADCICNEIEEYRWSGSDIALLWLPSGLLHSTKEAAELHAKALLSFTRKS